MLVDREVQDRENRRLHRYLKAARLRSPASVEDLDFRRPHGLDRAAVLSLAESHWVDAHRNLLILGPTGAGKTWIACALTQAAIRQGNTAPYLRAPRMLEDLVLARADGRLPRLMTAWAKVAVLLIDDLALRPLTPEQAADLLEVIETATIADAILDRLVHNAHRIELRGDSQRRLQEGAPSRSDGAAEARPAADEARLAAAEPPL